MRKRIFKVLSILFLGMILFGLFLYFHFQFGFSIPCPFHKITGFYCPGCGITRCVLSLLQRDFYVAFRYNPLVFILLPFILFYFGYQLYLYITNQKDQIIHRIPRWVWYLLIGIVLLFGILRNIPAFSFLAPLSK